MAETWEAPTPASDAAGQELISQYLGRLDAASIGLPPAQRAELRAEIGGHIDEGIQGSISPNEAAVRNLLDRLGPPEEIVAAAQPLEARPSRTRRVDGLAIAAIIVLSIVGLVFPFSVPVGLVLVLASSAWRWPDKAIAAALPPVSFLIGAALSATASGVVGPSSFTFWVGLLSTAGLTGLLSALYLLVRLIRPRGQTG